MKAHIAIFNLWFYVLGEQMATSKVANVVGAAQQDQYKARCLGVPLHIVPYAPTHASKHATQQPHTRLPQAKH